MNYHKRSPLCTVLLIIGIAGLILSCRTESNPIDMRPFLISFDQLPPNWSVYGVNVGRPMVGLDQDQAIEMVIYYESDSQQLTRGVMTVYRYLSPNKLENWYARHVQRVFDRSPASYEIPPFQPEGMELHLAADDWRFGCYGIRAIPDKFEATVLCQYIGRYAYTIVTVQLITQFEQENTISVEELAAFITTIDKHVSQTVEEVEQTRSLP